MTWLNNKTRMIGDTDTRDPKRRPLLSCLKSRRSTWGDYLPMRPSGPVPTRPSHPTPGLSHSSMTVSCSGTVWNSWFVEGSVNKRLETHRCTCPDGRKENGSGEKLSRSKRGNTQVTSFRMSKRDGRKTGITFSDKIEFRKMTIREYIFPRKETSVE